jgi:hypothetical protein
MLKLSVMAAVLFITLVDGPAVQQYQITGEGYPGDFETDEQRDRAAGETVVRQQRQNPGLTYTGLWGLFILN